jgi:ADP-heptose:LPS heptosyltransferase
MKTADYKKILVFRTDRIGDLILTCPTILTIKQNFKNSKITLVTSVKNFDYAKNLNLFDKLIIFPNKGIINKVKFMRNLSKEKFDYTFIFDGKDRSVYTSALIKSKYKVALIPDKRIKYFCKLFNIKFFLDTYETSVQEIFDKLIGLCGLNKY